MLAPHAVDIAVMISSRCFTFAEPFDNIFLFVKSSCALVSRNTNKSLRPKEGRKERPTDRSTKRVNSRLLTELLFRILQNSRKNRATRVGLLWRPFKIKAMAIFKRKNVPKINNKHRVAVSAQNEDMD